ncbi:hypothetical protein ADIS_3782 [Lunatimonas lonarensis]|uniref:Uncharacterized protein n=1 Tax=Lunatimonas lonarensis TaxID=1232681 RepID=R7ZNR6_9BACT|nr:hypothetical protein [Lunatimonas lonarensis]EON75750.1 hypothetical protein ADIS_3782 [Lunatimonas lonarensis]
MGVRNLSYTIDTVLVDSKGEIFLGGERTGIYNFHGELEHRFDWNAITKENGGILDVPKCGG